MSTLERRVELEPTPASASAARRLVREALESCGHEEWQDAAELAVSELVTNGVLHAHTLLTLTVQCGQDELRVEVQDLNPARPALRRYGNHATTGRGMQLVASVTTSHGVTGVPTGGKVVWFTIGAGRAELNAEDLLAAWDDDWREVDPTPTTRTVRLVELPPTLWLAASQHHDALLRELTLHRDGNGEATDDLVTADRARSAIGASLGRALVEAKREGRARNPLPANHPSFLEEVPTTVDLDVQLLGDDPAADFAILQDVLDEAERLAAAGFLLARPSLPEIVALRDWACESVIAQVAGQPPSPWAGASAERFAQALDQHEREVDWDASSIRDSTRGAIAADDANRILAISKPLADVLGWAPEALVGRRVVAIVPPHFREAHVAGFTRHLTTGQAHALNVRLELPVLRADGSELDCEFFIEGHRSESGRAIYIAWITPLDR